LQTVALDDVFPQNAAEIISFHFQSHTADAFSAIIIGLPEKIRGDDALCAVIALATR
jgi:hypothetical protein